MKNKFLTFIGLLFPLLINSQVIKLEGVYKGENLFVMNPFNTNGVGFCVYEVKVNGQTTTDEIQSSAFEIDLSIYNFTLGEKLTIEIYHHEDCQPKILNPEVIKPQSTFKLASIKIKNGYLTWTTYGELGSLPFIVEQYKWNKWIPVKEVQGKGTPGKHTYSVKVKFHSGINKFRIKQIDYTQVPKYSQVVVYKSTIPEIKFYPGNGKIASNYIEFSQKTDYEIFNSKGKLVKKGFGKKIDITNLPAGTYFINYDNKTEYFIKK